MKLCNIVPGGRARTESIFFDSQIRIRRIESKIRKIDFINFDLRVS